MRRLVACNFLLFSIFQHQKYLQLYTQVFGWNKTDETMSIFVLNILQLLAKLRLLPAEAFGVKMFQQEKEDNADFGEKFSNCGNDKCAFALILLQLKR